jgi:heme-degrading monooxygenase HmoA
MVDGLKILRSWSSPSGENIFSQLPNFTSDKGGVLMGDQYPVYLVGVWTVRPGNEDEFIAAWKEFAALTSQSKGAVYGKLLRDMADPGRFVSFGPWENLESAQAWRRQPEFRKAFDRFMELCDQVTPGAFGLVAESARKETV